MQQTAVDLFNRICDYESVRKNSQMAFTKNVFGELFLEYKETEILKIENGIVQSPSYNFSQGFGLRAFIESTTAYSYSSTINAESVKQAVDVVSNIKKYSTVINESMDANPSNASSKLHNNNGINRESLYESSYFLKDVSLNKKISFLKSVDEYARTKYTNIKQLIAVLTASWQVVSIIDENNNVSSDIRPLVRFSVTIVTESNGAMESGMFSGGGRFGYSIIFDEKYFKDAVDEAFRQAEVKISAKRAPVGELPVVLGNGWTGILLHEAIGHGLEADAIHKKTSSFHNLLGENIATKNINVVDDGTIKHRRGSINIDDEGRTSNRTMLIENGKLVGFINDRMNSILMNNHTTGNGRRESYTNAPIPRMTNTFMMEGSNSPEEMINSIKYGIYAKTFSDGQVDVASGKFVFSASEAYLIENGKITTPVKGAMLIGDGPNILKKISMVGNDFSLDNGTGICGKDGQWVPVGVGQPSVLIDNITVGGSDI